MCEVPQWTLIRQNCFVPYFNNPQLSDVVLVYRSNQDDVFFYGHAIILCNVSPFFHSLMIECNDDVSFLVERDKCGRVKVFLEDDIFDVDATKCLLEIIYGKRRFILPNTVDFLGRILTIVDYWKISFMDDAVGNFVIDSMVPITNTLADFLNLWLMCGKYVCKKVWRHHFVGLFFQKLLLLSAAADDEMMQNVPTDILDEILLATPMEELATIFSEKHLLPVFVRDDRTIEQVICLLNHLPWYCFSGEHVVPMLQHLFVNNSSTMMSYLRRYMDMSRTRWFTVRCRRQERIDISKLMFGSDISNEHNNNNDLFVSDIRIHFTKSSPQDVCCCVFDPFLFNLSSQSPFRVGRGGPMLLIKGTPLLFAIMDEIDDSDSSNNDSDDETVFEDDEIVVSIAVNICNPLCY